MFMFILLMGYMVVGILALAISCIKMPFNTPYGKAYPVEAEIAFWIMFAAWPWTVRNRRKFALYTRREDDDNPYWLTRQ